MDKNDQSLVKIWQTVQKNVGSTMSSTTWGAAIVWLYRRGSRIFGRGGGPGADTEFFTSTPPPWLRKFEKHPHSWTFTSTPPPLGHCPRDVIRPQKILKNTPTLGHSQKGGGSNFGPNVKKPTSWPKGGGGVRTPWTPPPGSATVIGLVPSEIVPKKS